MTRLRHDNKLHCVNCDSVGEGQVAPLTSQSCESLHVEGVSPFPVAFLAYLHSTLPYRQHHLFDECGSKILAYVLPLLLIYFS